MTYTSSKGGFGGAHIFQGLAWLCTYALRLCVVAYVPAKLVLDVAHRPLTAGCDGAAMCCGACSSPVFRACISSKNLFCGVLFFQRCFVGVCWPLAR